MFQFQKSDYNVRKNDPFELFDEQTDQTTTAYSEARSKSCLGKSTGPKYQISNVSKFNR